MAMSGSQPGRVYGIHVHSLGASYLCLRAQAQRFSSKADPWEAMLTSNLEGNRARSRCKDLSRLRTGETLITYYETSCEENRGKENGSEKWGGDSELTFSRLKRIHSILKIWKINRQQFISRVAYPILFHTNLSIPVLAFEVCTL